MKVVRIGDPLLREKAVRVKQFGESLKQILDQMVVLMKKKSGVGLAAPQVGISERFFVVQEPGGQPIAFVNPEILETSMETSEFTEGCLSVPGVWATVTRPASLRIQAMNGDGKVFRLDADGYLARIIQHELDHLNGVLFVDRMEEKDRMKIRKKLEKWESSQK